jgi:hypothetical protein
MCTKCLRYLTGMFYKGLEGRPPASDLQMPLIRPSNTCMLCSGPECQFCKQRNGAACRYAIMCAESLKKPCAPAR